jgi:phosphoglycolate phosphatase
MTNFKLVLFDIDGTLLDHAGVVSYGICQALISVYGTAGPVDQYAMGGKTDPQIMKELMLLAGLPAAQVESKLPDCCRSYIQVLEGSIASFNLYAYPGICRLLESLTSRKEPLLGLLTGNLAGVAGPKLKAAGIPPGAFALGAYGSDNADRNRLPGIAIGRAEKILGQPVEPGSVLVIGDTPYDIACARTGGTQVLAVATGDYSRAELARHRPDYLLDDLADLDAVLKVIYG